MADAGARPTDPAPRRASLATTASIVVFGHLSWLGWLWGVILVLLPAVILVIAMAGGELSSSLWASAGIGWQRWVLFAAGVVTASSFVRMFVTRGVTRRRVGRSSVAAMLVLSTVGSLVGVVGFVMERALFAWRDWPHEFRSGPFEASGLPRIALEHGLLMCIYFLAGWLVGAAFVRLGNRAAIVTIPVCLVPPVLVEIVVSQTSEGVNAGYLPALIDDPAIWLTAGVGAAVIAATSFLATSITRTLPVR